MDGFRQELKKTAEETKNKILKDDVDTLRYSKSFGKFESDTLKKDSIKESNVLKAESGDEIVIPEIYNANSVKTLNANQINNNPIEIDTEIEIKIEKEQVSIDDIKNTLVLKINDQRMKEPSEDDIEGLKSYVKSKKKGFGDLVKKLTDISGDMQEASELFRNVMDAASALYNKMMSEDVLKTLYKYEGFLEGRTTDTAMPELIKKSMYAGKLKEEIAALKQAANEYYSKNSGLKITSKGRRRRDNVNELLGLLGNFEIISNGELINSEKTNLSGAIKFAQDMDASENAYEELQAEALDINAIQVKYGAQLDTEGNVINFPLPTIAECREILNNRKKDPQEIIALMTMIERYRYNSTFATKTVDGEDNNNVIKSDLYDEYNKIFDDASDIIMQSKEQEKYVKAAAAVQLHAKLQIEKEYIRIAKENNINLSGSVSEEDKKKLLNLLALTEAGNSMGLMTGFSVFQSYDMREIMDNIVFRNCLNDSNISGVNDFWKSYGPGDLSTTLGAFDYFKKDKSRGHESRVRQFEKNGEKLKDIFISKNLLIEKNVEQYDENEEKTDVLIKGKVYEDADEILAQKVFSSLAVKIDEMYGRFLNEMKNTESSLVVSTVKEIAGFRKLMRSKDFNVAKEYSFVPQLAKTRTALVKLEAILKKKNLKKDKKLANDIELLRAHFDAAILGAPEYIQDQFGYEMELSEENIESMELSSTKELYLTLAEERYKKQYNALVQKLSEESENNVDLLLLKEFSPKFINEDTFRMMVCIRNEYKLDATVGKIWEKVGCMRPREYERIDSVLFGNIRRNHDGSYADTTDEKQAQKVEKAINCIKNETVNETGSYMEEMYDEFVEYMLNVNMGLNELKSSNFKKNIIDIRRMSQTMGQFQNLFVDTKFGSKYYERLSQDIKDRMQNSLKYNCIDFSIGLIFMMSNVSSGNFKLTNMQTAFDINRNDKLIVFLDKKLNEAIKLSAKNDIAGIKKISDELKNLYDNSIGEAIGASDKYRYFDEAENVLDLGNRHQGNLLVEVKSIIDEIGNGSLEYISAKKNMQKKFKINAKALNQHRKDLDKANNNK